MTNSLKKTTRREFLKKTGKIALIIGSLGLGIKGCIYMLPQEPASIRTYTEEYPLFDGGVTLRRTEKDGDFRWNGVDVISVKYEFVFNKPGHYLFEGWERRYRATDKRTENWQFDIADTSETRTEDLHSLVYRLEASHIVDGKIQRETLILRHHAGWVGF